MNIKHPENRNLTLYTDSHFQGLPLQTGYQPYIQEYLEIIYRVLCKAIEHYPRSFVIRFDLHLPQAYLLESFGEGLMTRFIKSMREIIDADFERKKQTNARAHESYMRFVWVREIDKSHHPHYHVVIFLNGDAYRNVGKVGAFDDNMANRVNRAWASALGMLHNWYDGLAYFPSNCSHFIELNKPQEIYTPKLQACFEHISYLAKSITKAFGLPGRNIGYSLK